MPRLPLSLAAVAACAVVLGGCGGDWCDIPNRPALQFLAGLLGCTSEDVFEGKLPTARITITPSTPRVGEPILLDGSSSSPGDVLLDTIVGYEWDTDGDGGAEAGGFAPATVPPGREPNPYRQATWTYETAGEKIVRLRVTNGTGLIDTRQIRFDVLPAGEPPLVSAVPPSVPGSAPPPDGPPPPLSSPTPPSTPGNPPTPPGDQTPVAALTAAPNPVPPGAEVTFDASASSDDGTIGRYEWDLDGADGFETDTGAVPTVSRSYPPGVARRGQVVRVRVTDDGGNVSELAELTLDICSVEGCGPGRQAFRRPEPAGTGARPATTSVTVFGALTGRMRRGRLVGRMTTRFAIPGPVRGEGTRPAVPAIVRRVLAGRWTLVPTKARKRQVDLRALVTTGRRGARACAAITVRSSGPRRPPRATLRVLGGTRGAQRLRLAMRFDVLRGARGARLVGAVRATPGAAPRRLPRHCLR